MASTFTIYKLIVLYMLKNTEGTLTNSQISDFVLERDYANYFLLQQSLSELAESGLIQKQQATRNSYYRITQDGRDILSYFENDISPEIRKEVLQYLNSQGSAIRKKLLTPADYCQNGPGEYTVRCQLLEENTSVINLTLTAPTQEAAEAMCKSWPEKCQDIYAMLMEELL